MRLSFFYFLRKIFDIASKEVEELSSWYSAAGSLCDVPPISGSLKHLLPEVVRINVVGWIPASGIYTYRSFRVCWRLSLSLRESTLFWQRGPESVTSHKVFSTSSWEQRSAHN